MFRLACLLVVSSVGVLGAAAQSAPSLTAPPTEKLVIKVRGEGVQVYACTAAKDGTWGWVLKGPEAKLLDDSGHEVGTHSAGPLWRLADGSEVMGKVMVSQPHADTIPWLLLSAMPEGSEGKLSKVDMVRRTDTTGGVAPTSGCDATHSGNETRVEYTATYSFYSAH